jgi:hypothetical protein
MILIWVSLLLEPRETFIIVWLAKPVTVVCRTIEGAS